MTRYLDSFAKEYLKALTEYSKHFFREEYVRAEKEAMIEKLVEEADPEAPLGAPLKRITPRTPPSQL